MKSKLSNKGYIIKKKYLKECEIKNIKKELTVSPFNSYQSNFSSNLSFPVYLESVSKLYLPRIWGINNLGNPDVFKVSNGIDINLNFNGSLREIQIEAKKSYLENCNENYGSGIICLLCGQGKTICSLNIVAHLKKKTLVIVHKEFLLNQWIERIKMFLPDAQIGRIQGKVFDIVGKDIVLAMLQSISMKNYDEDAFDSFGLTIVDECFPEDTLIHTSNGLISISMLYNLWKLDNKTMPEILSFNINDKLFEYKEMTYSWKKVNKKLLEIELENNKIIKCTLNHKILTNNGYIKALNLKINDIILCKIDKRNNVNINKIDVIKELYLGEFKIINIKEIENDKLYVYDIEVKDNHNFIIEYEKNSKYIEGPIVSNCHHISSEVFSRALPKVSTKYTLGLTATPNRTDGLTKIFNWYLGDIVYKGKRKTADNVYVKVLNYIDDNPEYCKIELGYDDKPITARMVNNVANYLERTEIIIETVKNVMKEEGRKLLILSDRREHLKLIYKKLDILGFDLGFYLGGMKQKDLDISETKSIILGTFSMSS